MISKAIGFLRWAEPWRRQFGTAAGWRVALSLRKATWAAPLDTRIAVVVPGLNPLQLRAGTSDSDVFSQVFGQRQADFPVEGSPAVIVDAGANIGLTTAIFASRFPDARILAVELDASNLELLEHNTASYPNVRTLHKALWSRKTRITIANPDAKSWEFRAREALPHERTSVDALGIADILAEFSLPEIDLLKIDIEGGEYEVFSGDVAGWIDRVRMIAIEVHDRFRPGCTDVVRKALAGRGFHESRWAEYLLFSRGRT